MGVRPLIGLEGNFLSTFSEFLPVISPLWGHPQHTRHWRDFPKLVDLSELSPLIGLLWDLQQFADLQPGLPQLVGLWWVVDLRGGSSTVIELLMTLS
jgi:hypothetical protein